MRFREDGVAFQQNAKLIGEQYELSVIDFLHAQGWVINNRNVRVSFFEIDIIATNPDGRQIWMECKSGMDLSVNGNPGLARLDTTQKAIGKAFGLSFYNERKPYWMVTSHLPNIGTAGDYLLKLALATGLIEKIWHLKFDEELFVVHENVNNKNQLSLEL